MKSLAGQLLIAVPHLADPNFLHTVTLLVRHEEDGAFGLVLNRPTGTALADVWEKVSDTACTIDTMLHWGGPCEGPLMMLHEHPMASDMGIADGLHYTVDKDNAEWLVEQGDARARWFVGYAGWSAGQLEQELDAGSWLTARADANLIFSADEKTWKQLVTTVVAQSVCPEIDPSRAPTDPSLN